MSKEDVLERVRELAEAGASYASEDDHGCEFCEDILGILDEYQEELLIDSGECEE